MPVPRGSDTFDDADLTADGFLNGRLVLHQPRHGYRAGIDPVLLAAAVPARAGQSVLDLGCGAGAALLCLAVRVPGLTLHGVERHRGYAALARQNAAANGTAAEIHVADVAALPADLRQLQFDHVVTNPPWFDRARGVRAPDAAREGGLGESVPPAVWISTAIRRLAPNGRLTLIHRAERLPEILPALAALGGVTVQPLSARDGADAMLVVVAATKGRRAPFRLCPPLALHGDGDRDADGKDYAPAIRAVLRDAAALTLGQAKYDAF